MLVYSDEAAIVVEVVVAVEAVIVVVARKRDTPRDVALPLIFSPPLHFCNEIEDFMHK
ncbi:MAG: hypothetical protein ABIJ21_00995 [Nanoarchaeota archaeon]